jgi:hypothetical protein
MIERGLYPGSFVHSTPSLVIPGIVYVDTDQRCKNFFEDIETKVDLSILNLIYLLSI